jgi:Flp pilus assembly protein TadB
LIIKIIIIKQKEYLVSLALLEPNCIAWKKRRRKIKIKKNKIKKEIKKKKRRKEKRKKEKKKRKKEKGKRKEPVSVFRRSLRRPSLTTAAPFVPYIYHLFIYLFIINYLLIINY